jgi:hypothetical protein
MIDKAVTRPWTEGLERSDGIGRISRLDNFWEVIQIPEIAAKSLRLLHIDPNIHSPVLRTSYRSDSLADQSHDQLQEGTSANGHELTFQWNKGMRLKGESCLGVISVDDHPELSLEY